MALPTPPGPPGVPFLGHVLRAWRDPLALMLEGQRVHGDTCMFNFGPQRYVLVHRADDIRRVLVQNRDNYPKSSNYDGLRLVLGNGLVTSSGELWKRQRQLAQPAFHRKALVGFVDTMTECTADLLQRWSELPDGAPLDVHEEMMRLTFRIVGRTLCSMELEDEAAAMGAAIEVALKHANDYVESVVRVPTWVPTPENLRFRRAMKTLDGIIHGIIEERRRAREPVPDLLGMLMAATDERGSMTDLQLRDELMTLVLAGHETTAVALSWTFFLLSRHPHVARKVEAEVDSVLTGGRLAFADLERLTYVGQVIDEAMRLYPPVWILERQALAADELGGFHVPAGTIIGISPYTIHRHPGLWDNPEGFDPERFHPSRAEERPRYAFMPFGGGPRICIGNHFALMESKILVATIVARYRLSLLPGEKGRMDAGITLRPRDGIRVSIHRRATVRPARAANSREHGVGLTLPVRSRS